MLEVIGIAGLVLAANAVTWGILITHGSKLGRLDERTKYIMRNCPKCKK
jgi:hypothetical protein